MKRSKYLILEFTEFNLQRLNSDSVQVAAHVDDPALSINAFDKHEDLVRGAISRLGQIRGALSGSAAYKSLKSKLSLEDQKIQNLTIIKIDKNIHNSYDVYLKFKINDEEYWGVIKDILGNCDFKSEVFKDYHLLQTKEWVVKLKGLIIKNVKSFLKPQFGKFKSLKDDVICFSMTTGNLLSIKKGTEIEVLKSYDNKIIFDHKGEKYTLTGDNFIYFNWWFEQVK